MRASKSAADSMPLGITGAGRCSCAAAGATAAAASAKLETGPAAGAAC
jgi:hypothetical protein